MPLFHVTAQDGYSGQPWHGVVEADTEAAAEAFLRERNLAVTHQHTVAQVPEGLIHLRVPAPRAMVVISPVARRLRLMGLGLGIGVFLIAGFLFVMKAKEHLTREKRIVPEAPTMQPDGSGSATSSKPVGPPTAPVNR